MLVCCTQHACNAFKLIIAKAGKKQVHGKKIGFSFMSLGFWCTKKYGHKIDPGITYTTHIILYIIATLKKIMIKILN